MYSLARLRVSPSELFAFQATDEFSKSSGGPSALLIGIFLALGIAAFVLAGLKAWERSRGRGREIRASAGKQDFDFAERGSRTLKALRFDVFMESTGFEATSVVSKKRPDGRRVHAFDYQLINEFELYKSPDGKKHRRRRGDPNTIGGAAVGREVEYLDVFGAAATISLQAFLRNVVIQPHTWHVSSASRLPSEDAVSGLDQIFMSMYRVRSDDKDFAQQFLNPGLIKMLVRTGGQFGLEVRGNQLLLFANEIKSSDMCDMALLAGVCADLIDPGLLAAYPEVVGIESDGSPRLGVGGAGDDATNGAGGMPFPGVEIPQVQRGPVLPSTLSGRTVPVISSDPQIPIEEARLPKPPAPAAPAHSAPATPPSSAGEHPPATEAPEPPPPAEAPSQAPPRPQPDSVDWSL